MQRRCIIIISFLFISWVYACGQKMAGRVADADTRKGLPLVTCKQLKKDGTIAKYCITDRNGRFAMDLSAEAVTLVFSHVGYAAIRMGVENANERMDIAMQQSENTLADIEVRAPAIVKKQDTLNYNVASFATKSDKYLEDVLKKMPGIEVTGDGTIKYQGKSISRFNIEGKNLLGGRYNQASQNMPAEAVATVQIMENDQHIRALKGVQFSENTTLNVKLKRDYKSKPFGEMVAGVGGFRPFMWNGRLTLFRFSAKSQTLLTAEANNRGKRLGNSMVNHFDMSSLSGFHPVPFPLLNDVTLKLLPVKENRYLDNQSYTAGLNHLFSLSRFSSLILNLTYINERENNSDSTYYEYGGENVFRLAESNFLKKQTHTLSPSVKYELNAPKVFLEEELKMSFSKTTIANLLTSNGEVLHNDMKQRPNSVQNNLQMTINAAGRVYSVQSFVRYFTQREELVTPFAENIRHRQLLVQNSVSTNFLVFKNQLSCEYLTDYCHDLFNLSGNESASSVFTHTWKPTYRLNAGKELLTLAFPVNFSYVSIPWNRENDEKRFYVSPSINWRHQFTPLFEMQLSGSYRESTGEEMISPLRYYSDYRTENESLDRMGWTKRWNMGASFRYQSILHLFSWYFISNASWTHNDHYFEYAYTPAGSRRHPVWEKNSQRSYYILTTFQKTVSKGTNLKGTLNYNRMEMPMAQNGIRETVKSNILSAVLDVMYSKLSWMNVSVSTTGNIHWNNLASQTKLKSFYNDLTVRFFPLDALSFYMTLEHNAIETEEKKYENNLFLDAMLEYSPSKRVSMKAELTNL